MQAEKALVCKQSTDFSFKNNAMSFIYIYTHIYMKIMFIHTYEQAFHNFQSHIFICFGPLLSGRQPHCTEHSTVSKFRQNSSLKTIWIRHKKQFCLNWTLLAILLVKRQPKRREGSCQCYIPFQSQRDFKCESFSLFTPCKVKKQYGKHIWEAVERCIDTLKFWRKVMNRHVSNEDHIQPVCSFAVRTDSIHEQFQHASMVQGYKFRSQTENFKYPLYSTLNLYWLLAYTSI